jgi:hypothetical protein
MMSGKACAISYHHVLVIAMDFILTERKRTVNRIYNVWITVLPIKVDVLMDNGSIEIWDDVHQLIKYRVKVSQQEITLGNA